MQVANNQHRPNPQCPQPLEVALKVLLYSAPLMMAACVKHAVHDIKEGLANNPPILISC